MRIIKKLTRLRRNIRRLIRRARDVAMDRPRRLDMKGFRKESLLVTEDGILALEEVGDISGGDTQVIDLDVANDVGMYNATEFIKSGSKQIGIITMDSGARLEAFGLHEFKTLTGSGIEWKQVQDLQINDVLPYRLGGYLNTDVYIPFGGGMAFPFTQPTELNEDVGWVLGVYFANGTNLPDDAGIVISGQISFLTRALHMIDTIFDIQARITIDPGDQFIPFQSRTGTITIESTALMNWLAGKDLRKSDNTQLVKIPKLVRQSPISVIRNFIEGFHISTGGSIPGMVKELRTESFLMAQHLLIVLRAIGNNSRMFDQDGSYLIEYDLEQIERDSKRNQFNMLPDKIISLESDTINVYDLTIPTSNGEYLANSYSGRN